MPELDDIAAVVYPDPLKQFCATSEAVGGKVVELADVNTIFENPLHPYTRGLIVSRPDMSTNSSRLNVIPGNVPDLSDLPEGCSFNPRCDKVCEMCHHGVPELVEVEPGHFVRCFVTGGKTNE